MFMFAVLYIHMFFGLYTFTYLFWAVCPFSKATHVRLLPMFPKVYSGLLAACGSQGYYDTVKGLLDEMKQFQVETNTVVLNAAMSAFIKCGLLEDAYEIYHNMDIQTIRPDLETYNTLMQSFVQQSYWQGAIHTLESIRSASQDPDSGP